MQFKKIKLHQREEFELINRNLQCDKYTLLCKKLNQLSLDIRREWLDQNVL